MALSKFVCCFALLALVSSSLTAAEVEEKSSEVIRVVPMDPTPESDTVATHIVFPEEGEIKTENPVSVQLRVEGFPLGFNTDFPRKNEIRDDKRGQTIHILVDNQPFVEVDLPIDDTADTEEIDFDQTIQQKLPFRLKPGLHVIRVFPVRSYGEGLKGDGCFSSSYFYMKKKGNETIDLSRPYLTYNQPEGEFSVKQPVLLDFYISNTQLSRDGYKVRLTIDKSEKRILTKWVPYYIYGLKKGAHTIKLELLDPNNKVIPGLFDDTEKTIVLK